jgi:hypothetical protein
MTKSGNNPKAETKSQNLLLDSVCLSVIDNLLMAYSCLCITEKLLIDAIKGVDSSGFPKT